MGAISLLRRVVVQLVWAVECIALTYGGQIVLLLLVTGGNLVLASGLLGSFLTHFARAEEGARLVFLAVALPVWCVWLGIVVALRWKGRPQWLNQA